MQRRMFIVVAAAVLSLTLAIPASAGVVAADVTINPTGTVSAAGAGVAGTVVCPTETGAIPAVVTVRQAVGAQTIEGTADTELPCDGDLLPWAVLIRGAPVGDRGISLFREGAATASILANGELQVRTITLRPTWSHVGTGPLATSSGTRAAVRYPTGIAAGDLLLLGCQGRRNAMNWSAPGYTSVPADTIGPVGPAGLRFELLTRWAAGDESGSTLSVSNVTGVNGWSCAITAMRGGAGKGLVFYFGGATANQARRDMVAHDQVALEGYLITHWFASSDDNNHGSPSHGVLAFGGTAYDTGVGTDHAASMSWHVGIQPECPLGCPPPAGAEPFVTMRQRSNGPDSYAAATFVFSPIELEPA